MAKKNKFINLVHYFTKNLLVMVGIVMIWRGIWVILDIIEESIFGGPHLVMGVLTIVGGLLLLYLPDKDLDEIQKL